jgi:hypothetical protein
VTGSSPHAQSPVRARRVASEGIARAVLVAAGALVAWGLWLAEVCWLRGWRGLAWLSGFQWAAVPICLILMVVAGVVVGKDAGWRARAAFVGAGAAVSLVAFVLARQATYELFAGGLVPGSPSAGPLVELFVAWAGASVGLTMLANRWLAPLRAWASALVAVALVAALPLAFATIQIVPALNGSTDFIHAVKMGYPVFWTSLLVPLALLAGRGQGAA